MFCYLSPKPHTCCPSATLNYMSYSQHSTPFHTPTALCTLFTGRQALPSVHFISTYSREFPNSPVVRTLSFPCRGPRLIPHEAHSSQAHPFPCFCSTQHLPLPWDKSHSFLLTCLSPPLNDEFFESKHYVLFTFVTSAPSTGSSIL